MTERDLGAIPGAHFWRDGEAVLFQFVIDPSNIVGPRAATEADQKAHADAWAAFQAGDADAPVEKPRKRSARA